MKPIVKKILEAGLVDKHTALLMEKWKAVDEGAAELVGREDIRKASEETLLKFVDDIEGLLEEDRAHLLETKMNILLNSPQFAHWGGKDGYQFVLYRDDGNNFIFPPNLPFVIDVGGIFFMGRNSYEIDEVTPLHTGTSVCAIQIAATKHQELKGRPVNAEM